MHSCKEFANNDKRFDYRLIGDQSKSKGVQGILSILLFEGCAFRSTTLDQLWVRRLNTDTNHQHQMKPQEQKGEKRKSKTNIICPSHTGHEAEPVYFTNIESIQYTETERLYNSSQNPVQKNSERSTHMLASSRPRSFTGVPDFGETKQLSDSSSRPIIRPGHHDPLRRRTQTKPPTDASMALVVLDPSKLPISTTPGRPTFPILRFQKQMHI